MQVTSWFSFREYPTRSGEYEVSRLIFRSGKGGYKLVRSQHRLEFRADTETWHYTKRARMAYPGCLAAMHEGARWRGLASDPKGK